jgi:hypothetical protein
MPGPLAPVSLANVYDLIITMRNIANPDITWRNTYTFYSPTVPVVADPFPQHAVVFQQNMIWADCEIVEVSCYNWSRGTQPYPSGMPLWTIIVAYAGTAVTHWGAQLQTPHVATGAEVVMRLDHSPAVGNKPGRNFYRGLLGMGDVASISVGKWILIIAIAILQAILDTIGNTTLFYQHLAAGASAQKLVVVRYSPKTHTVHGYTPVTAINLIDVTTNKKSRKNRR